MKRMSNPLLRSKAALLFMCVATGMTVVVSSCKKNDQEESAPAVSQAEVATVVNSAVTNGGVAAQTSAAATTASMYLSARKSAKTTGDDCGYTDEDSFQFSSDANASTTFSIDYTYKFVITCAADQYQSFGFTFAAKTSLATNKIAVADTSAATFTITGLEDASKNLVFNQAFDNKASLISKDGTGNSFYSTLKYTATDVTVSKSTLQIISGTAAVKITGTTTAGKSFSYEGQIVYKGGNKAVFTITGGSSFDLQW